MRATRHMALFNLLAGAMVSNTYIPDGNRDYNPQNSPKKKRDKRNKKSKLSRKGNR